MDTKNKENEPHPHAELIKAWADGAKIQWFDDYDSKWKDTVDNTPMWDDKIQYRIKTEESTEPWKPKEIGEYYWVIQIDSRGIVFPRSYFWVGNDIDNKFGEFGNCFRTREEAEAAIPRVKAALNGKVGDKVMSREEADSAMRSSIGICAIIDKNTSLLRENNKLKKELESFIPRCEYLQKEKEQLIASNAAVDGVTLTDGEKALIKALRRGRIFQQYVAPHAVVVEALKDGNMKIHHEFVAFCMHSNIDTARVRAAIKQVKAEQEANQ